jgi:hypothetical protein|tara:strand:- start:42 stop:305 length:264 start_codon:yes stop_codon:yes gene_type:complete
VSPYEDKGGDEYKIRTFASDVKEDALIWHRDVNDREITVLEGVGWQLQMDNELPVELVKGKLYNINSMEYHRIIKGEDSLKIEIWEK